MMKIMIVDDSKPVRSFLRDMLLRVTSDISTAEDGEEALSRYPAEHPDLVLMDIRMPHMDGITTTGKIRAIDPAARIVIVSEHDIRAYREDARNAGAEAYFLKEHLIDLLHYVRNAIPNPG